ncbi:hypothetical protein BpHYR1_039899 [Brachionus plicatilis]|uniref:Uncharacterized protein n=1 Tax=Brachionus plicatilis TaxID=10195 RepID=A0A3M7R201_BRAPC|nr:hypothetical protein BpHYR1_039899 [Brachionus plicatilis]
MSPKPKKKLIVKNRNYKRILPCESDELNNPMSAYVYNLIAQIKVSECTNENEEREYFCISVLKIKYLIFSWTKAAIIVLSHMINT